ncbi:MAG: hypothetical protein HY753_09830, partial [Nitrospirae bacterium]|nr:hypothetical protein [Nitrospirota bacterium]
MKGFIDLHTHGIGRYDTRTKRPEDILKMAELHGKRGTKAILPTIYPASIREMRENMEAVKRAMEMQDTRCKIQDAGYKLQNKKYRASCIMHHASLVLGVYL